MPRTIIVTVGISLIADHLDKKEKPGVGFGQIGRPAKRLSEIYRDLLTYDEDPKRPIDLEQGRWADLRAAVVEKLVQLWQNDRLTPDEKHLYADAELASLHLLGRGTRIHELFNHEDRVLLLASDTHSGWFCAAVLCDALAAGLADFPKLDAHLCKIEALNAMNAEDFLYRGLPNLAETVARQPGPRLLVASGGYKGLLPYLTPIAMQLQIPLLYLYENSNRLLEIRPLQLPADLWVLDGAGHIFSEIDPTLDQPPGDAATFWSRLDSKRRKAVEELGLVEEKDGNVTLSSTGILAMLLYRLKKKADKQP